MSHYNVREKEIIRSALHTHREKNVRYYEWDLSKRASEMLDAIIQYDIYRCPFDVQYRVAHCTNLNKKTAQELIKNSHIRVTLDGRLIPAWENLRIELDMIRHLVYGMMVNRGQIPEDELREILMRAKAVP